ncbi:plastocyanin [Mycolicibacterium sp. CH28]|uniref:cupredoxin domain-containing protein n=1 Tax=Mycolicibacterium sp. CH28 TaxID=2512237 RepID=UPI00107FE476|nr:cupredoxin domain-containing protein [Mycolicibacterium sp. CH28]TGD89956.1 plastocyanin [Mycolicibacterium sp. CH28]
MTARIAALLASLLLVAACSSGTTSTPAAPAYPQPSPTAAGPATPAGPTIGIADMKFTSPVSVPPGATVTVTNSDGVEHTVTADAGNAFNVEVGDKASATFTAPSQPGTYPFHCAYHPMMHGQLIVQ